MKYGENPLIFDGLKSRDFFLGPLNITVFLHFSMTKLIENNSIISTIGWWKYSFLLKLIQNYVIIIIITKLVET